MSKTQRLPNSMITSAHAQKQIKLNQETNQCKIYKVYKKYKRKTNKTSYHSKKTYLKKK